MVKKYLGVRIIRFCGINISQPNEVHAKKLLSIGLNSWFSCDVVIFQNEKLPFSSYIFGGTSTLSKPNTKSEHKI